MHLSLAEVFPGNLRRTSKSQSNTGYSVAPLNSTQPPNMAMMDIFQILPLTGQILSLMSCAILSLTKRTEYAGLIPPPLILTMTGFFIHPSMSHQASPPPLPIVALTRIHAPPCTQLSRLPFTIPHLLSYLCFLWKEYMRTMNQSWR